MMTIQNLFTVESIQLALAARQAQRELDAALLMAEIVLREQAQKNRQARQRLTVY